MKEQIKNTLSGILLVAMTFSFFLLHIPACAAEPESTVPDQAKIKVLKVDSVANVGIPGATFGIYRDEACTDVITNMAETDENGEA